MNTTTVPATHGIFDVHRLRRALRSVGGENIFQISMNGVSHDLHVALGTQWVPV